MRRPWPIVARKQGGIALFMDDFALPRRACRTLRGSARRSRCLAGVFGIALTLLAGGSLPAQEPAAEAVAPAAPTAAPGKAANLELTREAIQQRIEQSKTAKELDDKAKADIADLYQKALQELDRGEAIAKQAAAFDQQAKQAPAQLQKLRQQLDEPTSKLNLDLSPTTEIAELEGRLAQAQTDLANAQDELTQLDAEPKRRAERRLASIPKGLEEAAKQLADLQKSLEAPPAENDPAELTAARQTQLLVRKAAKEKEIALLKSERECYNAEDELLPKRRDLAVRRVAEKKALVDEWQEVIHDRREEDATEKLKQATREKKDTCPELQIFAAENEDLAKRAKTTSDEIASAEHQISEFKNTLAELKREFTDLQARYGSLESTPEIGPLLLQYRADLRRKRQHLDQVSLPSSTIVQLQLELATLDEQRKKLNDIPARAEEIIRTLDLSRPHPPSREQLDYELRELLRNRCDILDSLSAACNRYFGKLVGLTDVEEELTKEIAVEAEYIDERILWVRSTSALALTDFAAASECLKWCARPAEWAVVAQLLSDDLLGHLFLTLATGALFVGLLAAQRKLRTRIREHGEHAARASTDDMAPTLRVLVLTALMSIPWSLLLIYLGWRLGEIPRSTELAQALAWGLKVTGIVLLPLELIRHVCRGRGLGHAHFGWPEASLKTVRRHLRWFMFVGLPLTFAAATTHALENDRWRDSLGRSLFIVAMLLLAVFVERVFRPMGGMLQEFIASRGAWVHRLNFVLLPVSAGAPLVLAALAALGYFYTAQQLAARLQGTAWLFVGLLIAGALALRWVLVSRRRLAIRQARQRRAAALAAAQASESSGTPSAPAVAEAELDLTTINAQTRRLVQAAVAAALLVGLWGIWADVLPALSILDWPLWYTNGAGGIRTSVNISHLLLACGWFMMMVIASRNIPGLLEIALLQRLPLEPATRYAITTLSRYAITVLGIIAVCGTVGITWEKVHWLLAAVSVGLGFGLQEIFANFISGLIILFERPVRVGDIVTVGDVSGVVSRIRIRATMIVDWDRKELIVPNKEFITGRVLNWTLSDQMNRVVVNVGVAYGSDIAKVRELLLKIAGENEFIMKDPAPMASFEGFGDSSLNLVLRCYLPNLENRLAVVHDLHMKIHNLFQAEGIEIPFPQRDLNVRYLDAPHANTVPLAASAKYEAQSKRQQASA